MNWLSMTSTGHGDRANNLVRYGRAVVLCLSLAVLVTWLNSAWAGTIKVDDCPASLLQRGVIGTLLTLSLGAAAFFFLKAWLAAARQPLDGLLPIALLLHVICFAALPSTTNDVFSNITFGRELLAGLNPYHDVPSKFGTDPIVEYMGSVWMNTPSVYGPLANLVSGLAAWPPGVWAPMLLFKLFMLACSLGSILLGYDLCRSCLSPKWAAPAFVVLAWNPLLAWDVSSQAHNDGLLVLAFSAFVWAASRKRQWLAAAALIVGFYFKFATLPLIGLYGLYVGRCRPLRCLLMGAGLVVAGVALFAPFWRGTATLHPTLLASTGRHDYASNSLYWLVREVVCIVQPRSAPTLFSLWTLATRSLCLALAGIFALRARSVTNVIQGGLVFLLVTECLATPWYQPQYATWLLPLALACRNSSLQWIVAIFTATVPVLYLPGCGGYVSLIAVHVIPLVLLARWWRLEAVTPAESLGTSALAGTA